MDQIITPEQMPPKSHHSVWLAVGIITAIFLVGLLAYYLYHQKITVDKTVSETENNSTSGDNQSWQTYKNTKLGFSTEFPNNFKQNSDEQADKASFSEDNGRSGGESMVNIFSSTNIWYENSTQTPKEAIDTEKVTVQSFPIQDFKVISQENVTISGQPGVKAVWSYSDLQTNSATVSAQAYTSKNGKLWKITFLVGGVNEAEVEKTWSDTSYIFDKMISSFTFL